MGFDPADVAVLVDLVRHHLLLPSFATGRDLDDPATIDAVADAVGTEDTLDLLAALTVADSLATGPTAWSAWKAGLRRAAWSTQARARAAPARRRRGAGRGRCPTGATRTSTPSTARSPSIRAPAASPSSRPTRSGLLAVEVAVLGVHAQSVRRARTFTVDGVAVGEFELEPERGREPDWDRGRRRPPRRARRPRARSGSSSRPASARYGTFSRPTAARPADPRVFVDNDATDAATIVEVRAADGIGVLARITDAIAGRTGAGGAGVRVDPRPRGGRHLLRDRAPTGRS